MLEHGVEVGRRVRIGRDPGRQDRRKHKGDGDHEGPAEEAPGDEAPPARARRHRQQRECRLGLELDVAHRGAPDTRMRGLSSEYAKSTQRLTTTYPAAATRTTP